jgi:hypothetical protein
LSTITISCWLVHHNNTAHRCSSKWQMIADK